MFVCLFTHTDWLVKSSHETKWSESPKVSSSQEGKQDCFGPFDRRQWVWRKHYCPVSSCAWEQYQYCMAVWSFMNQVACDRSFSQLSFFSLGVGVEHVQLVKQAFCFHVAWHLQLYHAGKVASWIPMARFWFNWFLWSCCTEQCYERSMFAETWLPGFCV